MDRVTLERRGRTLVPSLFTVGNMACGFVSLLASGQEEFGRAGWAILVGIVFDILDGRVARFVRGESSFGVEFDSLSDWFTFGIAPAYMMYSLLLKDYGFFGAGVAFLYALCGALRLARFNLVALSGAGVQTHFRGLPIPAGAGILASFVLLYDLMEKGGSARTVRFLMNQVPLLYVLVPFAMLALAFLMVSTVPYAAFKRTSLFRPRSLKVLLIAVMGMCVAYAYPQNALFLFFLAYVLSGLVGWAKGRYRAGDS